MSSGDPRPAVVPGPITDHRFGSCEACLSPHTIVRTDAHGRTQLYCGECGESLPICARCGEPHIASFGTDPDLCDWCTAAIHCADHGHTWSPWEPIATLPPDHPRYGRRIRFCETCWIREADDTGKDVA